MSTQAQREVKIPPILEIYMDPEVKKVLEFIYANVPCARRVAVAKAVKDLATPLWGHYVKPIGPYDIDDLVIPISFVKGGLAVQDD